MQQLVVFSLAGEHYGLPITQVQEIIRYRAPRSVPSPAASIRGVINLRDRIIPICDLQGELGLTATERDDNTGKIVIIDTAVGTVGLIVESVDQVMTVEDEQVEPGAGSQQEYVSGIAKIGSDLVILLQPDALAESIGLALTELAA
jgi:purine-binding chemotaxis protein CheW